MACTSPGTIVDDAGAVVVSVGQAFLGCVMSMGMTH